MANNILKIPASEQLRQVASDERDGKLIPVNEYKPDSFEYGATNPNAISDGDAKGKGDLGKGTVGNDTDIAERSKLLAVNNYKDSNTYPDSSVV
jgi:hypothetical protein